jgi:hypothetical protein
MTGRTNRLIAASSSSSGASDTGCPKDLDGYCAWLNVREARRGQWVIATDKEGRRYLDWHEDIATDDWLREKGLVPKIGSRAA